MPSPICSLSRVCLLISFLVPSTFLHKSCFRSFMLLMEAPQVIGDIAEECSSCESGWTMYLSSPAHHADDDDDSEMESAEVSCISSKRIHGGDEDDDSMASDASTGGIQRNLSCDHLGVTDDNGDDNEEVDSNEAHGGFEKVKCCSIRYPPHNGFPKRMCIVQEARSVSSGIMVSTSRANVVSGSKVRHDIVAGDKR